MVFGCARRKSGSMMRPPTWRVFPDGVTMILPLDMGDSYSALTGVQGGYCGNVRYFLPAETVVTVAPTFFARIIVCPAASTCETAGVLAGVVLRSADTASASVGSVANTTPAALPAASR